MDTKALIEQFNPRTPLQKESKALILAELLRYGQTLYTRNCTHAHFTASAIIVNPSLDKTLMVYHNIYNSYSFAGGHADGQQDLYQVAYNEAKEETGIDSMVPVSRCVLSAEFLPVAAHLKNGQKVAHHHHYNVTFGFICPDKVRLQIKPEENSDAAFIDIDKLDDWCSEKNMLPVYHDAIKQIKKLLKQKEENYRLLPARLLPWYKKNARELPWRSNQNPYFIWLSEIMLQQTRVDTVIEYYNRFLAALPTIAALARADEEQVLKLWEGLGYYSRARNMMKASKIIQADYEGIFPDNFQSIRNLPGIGDYTAGAIASICFNRPVPAVDGNVLRVIARITEDYHCIDDASAKKDISARLAAVYPKSGCGDFTQSLMELGATICLPNGQPLCGSCPVNDICLAYLNETVLTLPVRKIKQPRKVQELTLFILTCGGKTAIQKRQEKGVLHNMWELPNAPGKLDQVGAMDYLHNRCGAGRITATFNSSHIFTHIKWQMICYAITCSKTFGDYVWVDKNKLDNEIPLPTAFKKVLHQ